MEGVLFFGRKRRSAWNTKYGAIMYGVVKVSHINDILIQNVEKIN